MRNHFHLVVETPDPNLVAGMKWMLGVYTRRFNIRHKLCGHLFAGRYKALLVDGSGAGYLRTVCDYVHLNPVRAKLIKPAARVETFPWSSYREYLKPSRERPRWLRVDRLLGEHGIPRDSVAGRREFAAQMERRRSMEEGGEYDSIRRGWCLGSEEFRKELMAAAADRMGPSHYGRHKQESLQEKAERIIHEHLKLLGCRENLFLARSKGDRTKVAMARRLRRETTMTYRWIAERLQMGSWGYVFNLLKSNKTATV